MFCSQDMFAQVCCRCQTLWSRSGTVRPCNIRLQYNAVEKSIHVLLKGQIASFTISARQLPIKSTFFHQYHKRAFHYFFYILPIFVLSKVKVFKDCRPLETSLSHPAPSTPRLATPRLATPCLATPRHLPQSPVTYKRRRRCPGDAYLTFATNFLYHNAFKMWYAEGENLRTPYQKSEWVPLSLRSLFAPFNGFSMRLAQAGRNFFSLFFFDTESLLAPDRLSTPESLPDIFIFLDPSSYGIFYNVRTGQ